MPLTQRRRRLKKWRLRVHLRATKETREILDRKVSRVSKDPRVKLVRKGRKVFQARLAILVYRVNVAHKD